MAVVVCQHMTNYLYGSDSLITRELVTLSQSEIGPANPTAL